ncbi:MAG: type II toxin-antitoxin system ParD family antitoxin [Planctomycetes bacterium]|nr:type II toxin-antitoxin system ParD family antitoxin [Planctomycetota bacterium]
MNVRLTPQQEAFVKQQVAEGRYLSEAEVIREGLRLLADELEWRVDARRKIAIGMEQLRAGQVVEGEQAVEDVLAQVRKRRPRAKGA